MKNCLRRRRLRRGTRFGNSVPNDRTRMAGAIFWCGVTTSWRYAISIVLAGRKRPADAPTATRRGFVTALKAELPQAPTHLQAGNIAPVDLAQAAIGPGMAVYTRYSRVLDAEGSPGCRQCDLHRRKHCSEPATDRRALVWPYSPSIREICLLNSPLSKEKFSP